MDKAPKTTIDLARAAGSVVIRGLTFVSVLILFAMMALTSVDVVLRYIFNSPVRGAFELTEIGLAMLVYLAFPAATLAGGHIAVELMPLPKSRLARRMVGAFESCVMAATFGVIAWQVWMHAGKLLSYGQVTNSLDIPLGYVASVVAVGAGIAALAALAKTVKDA